MATRLLDEDQRVRHFFWGGQLLSYDWTSLRRTPFFFSGAGDILEIGHAEILIAHYHTEQRRGIE